MADLVIGGSTYKNIKNLQVRQADGSTATFRRWSNEKEEGYITSTVSAYACKHRYGASSFGQIKTTATGSVAE